jgi:UDP-N-acetylmuramoyl-L-alanyl-D-glutamate--2,6-diaminopimelate ligase
MLDAAMPKGIEKSAVLNADDPSSPEIRAATSARGFWYGLREHAETRRRGDAGKGRRGNAASAPSTQHPALSTQHSALSTQDSLITATNLRLLPGGSRFILQAPAGSIEVESRLPGRFNVYNWLAAAAVGLSQGASLEQIRVAMAQVDSVPGRMQRIDLGQPFSVVVDFAHTPQALRTALGTLRPITPGRLLVLFGLAGERDTANRPVMGRVAARMADFALFTTDDPRFEDPMEIAEEIAAGARAEGWQEGENYVKIADREEAIREAFRRARPGDTVLLAGKGHERRQVIRGQMIPWNDAEAARRLLEAISCY